MKPGGGKSVDMKGSAPSRLPDSKSGPSAVRVKPPARKLAHSARLTSHVLQATPAKVGGSPRSSPVLCPERVRGCITAMLANQRDAKAELNRRSQVCAVLAGTGVRVAENRWSAAVVADPAAGRWRGLACCG